MTKEFYPSGMPKEKCRPDHVRRNKQAMHFARIIYVHNQISQYGTSVEVATKIAADLQCSCRTIWRDIKVLDAAYELMGSKSIKPMRPV